MTTLKNAGAGSSTALDNAQTLQKPTASNSKAPDLSRRKKRLRLFQSARNDVEPLCYIIKMPVEILAEILSYTASPQDVLSLARCSKYFCATLVNNPSTIFIWKEARARCEPLPVPNPTPNFTEPAYAAFLFDGGQCEHCGTYTKAMYTSFALRIRICEKFECVRTWKQRILYSVAVDVAGRYQEIMQWIPFMEDSTAWSPLNDHWSRTNVRKTDWFEAVDEYNKAVLEDTLAEFIREKQILADRLPEVMELARQLIMWRDKRSVILKEIKASNKQKTASIAIHFGLTVWYLMNTKTYSQLLRAKNAALEQITDKDYAAIHDKVTQEIHENQKHAQRCAAERAYGDCREEVAGHYKRLHDADPKQILPTLPEFRKLSIMKLIQSKSTKPIRDQLKNPKLVDELLQNELKKWQRDARAAFAAVLGFPTWRAARKTKLHPVDRLTARFRCMKCHKMASKDEESLNFSGACLHQCPNLSKKQRSRETWNANQFAPHQKIIDAVNQILQLCDTKAEEEMSLNIAKALGTRITCSVCPTTVALDFQNALRHCRRHEHPKFALLPEAQMASIIRHPVEQGLVAGLLDRSFAAKTQHALKIYGCRQCHQTAALEVASAAAIPSSRGTQESETATDSGQVRSRVKGRAGIKKLYTFNGLRSHVKETHGVTRIGDEDVFRVKEPEVAQ